MDSSPTCQLRIEGKVMQQRSLGDGNIIVLSQVCVDRQKLYPNKVIIFWLVSSFSYLQYSNFIANIGPKELLQVCSKSCRTRSYICIVRLNFLLSPWHFDRDETFGVILLHERLHGFHKISNGMLAAVFDWVDFWLVRKFFDKRTWIFPIHCCTLIAGLFPILQPPIAPLDSVPPAGSLWELSVLSCGDALETKSIVNHSFLKWLWATVSHEVDDA